MTGFINVNKAEGVSSAREVAIIKRLTGESCGHMGTLDPMASGVLPIAIGNATRLFDYFLTKRKSYRATFRFGMDTDTLDTTGTVLSTGGLVPTLSDIKNILPHFVGEISQVPPKYSAKSVGGRRGYDLAREGKDFELAAKNVNIYAIFCVEKVGEDSFIFDIDCGAGTYIRSLARDIGAALGTHAVMSALVRTKSGPFEIGNAIQTRELNAQNIADYVIPTQSLLNMESLTPSAAECKKLFNGFSVGCEKADGIYKIFNSDGAFYGLAEVKNGVLKVRTKLC